MTIPSAPTPALPRKCYPGRGWFFMAGGLASLGLILYAVQLWLGRLVTPWYMPGLTTLGIVLLAVALRKARSAWRWLALVMILLLGSAEWAFVLATRLPAYTGPAAVGKPLPDFATVTADGAPFTQGDLKGDQHSVLVFFRGRW